MMFSKVLLVIIFAYSRSGSFSGLADPTQIAVVCRMPYAVPFSPAAQGLEKVEKAAGKERKRFWREAVFSTFLYAFRRPLRRRRRPRQSVKWILGSAPCGGRVLRTRKGSKLTHTLRPRRARRRMRCLYFVCACNGRNDLLRHLLSSATVAPAHVL